MKSHLSSLIPPFLSKAHEKTLEITLNDASLSVIRKETFILACHSSGYLIPLKSCKTRETSFSDIAQFLVRLIEFPYECPTIYMLINKSEMVMGATSGILNRQQNK